MSDLPRPCAAVIPEPPWYVRKYHCSRMGHSEWAGYALCTQHRHKAERNGRIEVFTGKYDDSMVVVDGDR